MNAIAKNTAKLAVSAVLAILVTGVFGGAISVSATAKAPRSQQAHELRLASPAHADEAAPHHYG